MDPITNLKEQLDLAKRITDIQDHVDDDGNMSHEDLEESEAYGARLAELVLALDEWRRKGGFDPYQ